MVVLYFLFTSAVLFYLTSLTPIAEDCSSCNYYECAEKKLQCGPLGYPIGFGRRFCLYYKQPELTANFTTKGFDSFSCIRECLIEETKKLVDSATTLPYNAEECDEFNRTQYVKVHPVCYKICDFCNLALNDIGEALYSYLAEMFC
ncbi:hypothetical protein L596_026052 [Steinernema carpocapsae]|uniref:Uncharacterized protein n=1 Tax=Steinernema carpocapsae TaxID=34508 RepID=A0A4U5M077_STECR|nr:hypothetical protein L596_026052 [Steinernema carpocapsae]